MIDDDEQAIAKARAIYHASPFWYEHEDPIVYAKRRAIETRCTYIVSAMGHVWMLCDAHAMAEVGGIVYTAKPPRRRK